VGTPQGTETVSSSTAAMTRLLVVDDEPSIRSACRQVALSLGFQVDVAENVHEARLVL
jgi:DNA-binding NtrC family response regulator